MRKKKGIADDSKGFKSARVFCEVMDQEKEVAGTARERGDRDHQCIIPFDQKKNAGVYNTF